MIITQCIDFIFYWNEIIVRVEMKEESSCERGINFCFMRINSINLTEVGVVFRSKVCITFENYDPASTTSSFRLWINQSK